MKQAKKIVAQTDKDLFGQQDEYLQGLKLFLAAPDQKLMSASGILLLNGLIQAILHTRRRSIQYIQSHKDTIIHVSSKNILRNRGLTHFRQSRLEKPIIISGLPRTGSTMLYNLLSCDPKARAPRFFEISQMANPTPPCESMEQRDLDPRVKRVCTNHEGYYDHKPQYYLQGRNVAKFNFKMV